MTRELKAYPVASKPIGRGVGAFDTLWTLAWDALSGGLDQERRGCRSWVRSDIVYVAVVAVAVAIKDFL